jgi:hypothetical protein
MKRSINNYLNETVVRVKNKRIRIKSENGVTVVIFDFADENANTPAVGHKCSKNKIRHSLLKVSDESFELMIRAYYEMKRFKNINNKETT